MIPLLKKICGPLHFENSFPLGPLKELFSTGENCMILLTVQKHRVECDGVDQASAQWARLLASCLLEALGTLSLAALLYLPHVLPSVTDGMVLLPSRLPAVLHHGAAPYHVFSDRQVLDDKLHLLFVNFLRKINYHNFPSQRLGLGLQNFHWSWTLVYVLDWAPSPYTALLRVNR